MVVATTQDGRTLSSLYQALEGAGDAAIAVDAGQRIVLWNQAAEALLGWRRAETLGQPCHEVLCGRDRSGNLVCCARCAEMVMAERGEPIRNRDLCYRAHDGRRVWVNVSTLVIAPAEAGAGRVTVHLFRDVSHQRGVEELLDAFSAREGARQAGPSPLEVLTKREREILALLARGTETRMIARTLFISSITVRNHVQNILRKLGAHSRAEAVALGVRWGLPF